MQRLSIVLVGCGAVSRMFYRPALRVLETAGSLRVSALVDPSDAARRSLQASFPTAAAVARLAEVQAPRGSLVIVASPPRWHAPQTIEALARGWHVLCEKPMAASSDEARRMTATAEAAGLVLAIGHYKRFFPSSRYFKFLCGPDGPLGALQEFSIAEGGPFTWPATPAFFLKEETPGGVLFDLGVHVLDLLLWWLGEPSDFTYRDDAAGGLEANACLSLRFGAITGRVQLSRDAATAQRYQFQFERGRVDWTVNDANGISLQLNGAPFAIRGLLQNEQGETAESDAQSFIAQLKHVAAGIADESRVFVDGYEGLQALRLIEACYARRELLEQPWLTPGERARARAEVRPEAVIS